MGKEFIQAMRSVEKYEKSVRENNAIVLKMMPIRFAKSVPELIGDSCSYVGSFFISSKPYGQKQQESAGSFSEVWVDQSSVGDAGDSYAGVIYGKIAEGRWLAIPYEC